MPQATDLDLAWARDLKDGKGNPKPILAFRWSTNQAQIVSTKKRADELSRVWKKWKERHGWKVRGSMPNLIAQSPDGVSEACGLRVYDPESLAEIS